MGLPSVTHQEPIGQDRTGLDRTNTHIQGNGKESDEAPVLYSAEFHELWGRWLIHHQECSDGARLTEQTNCQLRDLLGFRDEQKATEWLELSLRKSKKGNLCDPNDPRFNKRKKSANRENEPFFTEDEVDEKE